MEDINRKSDGAASDHIKRISEVFWSVECQGCNLKKINGSFIVHLCHGKYSIDLNTFWNTLYETVNTKTYKEADTNISIIHLVCVFVDY